MVKKSDVQYQNNPFFIGFEGLKLFFNNAQSVAIYAIVLVALAAVLGTVAGVIDAASSAGKSYDQIEARNQADEQAVRDFFVQDAGQLAVAGILIASGIFLVIVIWLLLYGVLEYTAAQLALGKKATLKEAFRVVAGDLAGYVWLYIVLGVKIFLWSLLLIVPGIIMAVRYSLAGTVFFAEGKRGNAAVKRSAELTKGAWFTTYAGFNLWNIMTFTQITLLLMPGAAAIQYRQLRDVTDAGAVKPPAHWLSWLTFFVPIVLAIMFFGFAMLLLIAFSSFGS